jgi:hypothetical protein
MRPVTASPATLIVWFYLREPGLSAEFERMMAGDREVELGSLDTMSDWAVDYALRGRREESTTG